MREARWLTICVILAMAAGCGGQAAHLASPTERWVATNGGLETGDAHRRAEDICRQLRENLSDKNLTLHLLASDERSAYAWPSGQIFVTRGLVRSVSDDELAAAIAHEIGHLLDDGHMPSVASLQGVDLPQDIESRADMIGCRLLEAHGISPHAMIGMLEKVRRDPANDRGCCDAIARRIERLRSTLLTSAE